jgi:hypothetical protein
MWLGLDKYRHPWNSNRNTQPDTPLGQDNFEQGEIKMENIKRLSNCLQMEPHWFDMGLVTLLRDNNIDINERFNYPD